MLPEKNFKKIRKIKMPELPEVHTTIGGLKKVIVGKTIKDVWSDFYVGARYNDRQNIKKQKIF
jgi:formamidopyrimidine-DNA glycosylase